MLGGWVYIMSNKPRGTLYVGVTSDQGRRIWQHREGKVDGFTKKTGLYVSSLPKVMNSSLRPFSGKI